MILQLNWIEFDILPDQNILYKIKKNICTCCFTAAPGVKVLPAATGVVISQTAQVYQPHIISQPATQVTFLMLKPGY